MLDYISSFKGPTRHMAIREVYYALKNQNILHGNEYESYYNIIMENIYDEYYKEFSAGSEALWYTREKPEIIDRIKNAILKYRRIRKLLGILKSIYLLNFIYISKVKNFYKPYNKGYFIAENEFNQHKNIEK